MKKTRILFLLLVLFFVAAVGFSYSPIFDRYPALRNVFVSFREGIFNLPVGLGSVEGEAWSPDGHLLIFSAFRFTVSGRKVWSLYKVDPATRKVTRIGEYSGKDPIEKFVFSPLGQFLAIEFGRQSGNYVRFLNLETNTFFPLPMPAGVEFQSVSFAATHLSFMPDGKKFFFSGFDGSSHRLCRYDMEKGVSQVLPISMDVLEGSWSPAGDRILLLAQTAEGTEIVTASPDGSHPVPVYSGGNNCCLRYSPFGKKIAFLQQDHLKVSSTLGVVSDDGSSSDFMRGLPAEADALNWSSDGDHVFLEARNKNSPWGIYIYAVSSNKLRKMSGTGSNLSPVNNPQDRRLAFLSDRAFPGLYSLYVAGTDNETGERLTGWFFF